MSDIKVTVIPNPVIANDLEGLPVVGPDGYIDNVDTVAAVVTANSAPPLRFYHDSFQMLVSSNMQLKFHIPSGFAGKYEVWINYRSGPNVETVLKPQLFEAGQWHSIYVSGLKDGAGQFEGYWSIWGGPAKAGIQRVLVKPPATFDDGYIIQRQLTGTAVSGSTVYLVWEITGQQITDVVTVGSDSKWTLTLNSGVVPGVFRVYEKLPGLIERISPSVVCVELAAPVLTSPVETAVMTEFKGTAAAGTTLVVVKASDHSFKLSERKVVGSNWSLPLRPDAPLSWEQLQIQLQFQIKGSQLRYSKPYTVQAFGLPVITHPASGSTLEMAATISGDRGVRGAVIEILQDGGGTLAWKAATPSWDVRLDLRPGPISLVPETVVNGVRFGRGVPRAFKIRPAKMGDVKVEIIDKSITFSGTGYPGATVVITVPGSPVTLPQPIVAADGKWEIRATDWPLGKHPASIVQKVSDNASGWIESLPYNFDINNLLPDVYAVSSTADYQPTFSGKGFTGAIVKIFNPGGGSLAAPDVVVENGEWLSKASQQWGPTLKREVHIKQFLDAHQSLNWVKHPVTIPPQAPTINLPVEDGLSPTFSGTCWSGAVVTVNFSDDATAYPATENAGIWTLRRPTEFDHDTAYTITVSQTVATQTSPVATESFTIRRPMITPVITHPSEGSNVSHELMIKGSGGMKGATMQVRDVVYDKNLSPAQVLSSDGDWEVPVRSLNLRSYGIEAHQSDKNRVSKSKRLNFNVVVLPPQITQPTAGGTLPRTGKLKGRGRPGARVQVWMVDATKPWLENIVVRADGEWECEVTLPVGVKTIQARQSFEEGGKPHHSGFTEAVQYSVVPAAPFVETPVAGQLIGQRVVVSGFGVPGDTVTVKLGAAQASAAVMADRTWSVTLVLTQTGAIHSLEVTSALDEFESEAALRPVLLGSFLPSIDIPAAGRRVENPLLLAGRGRTGVGEAVSWYDPDQKWLADVPVTGNGWQGQAVKPLRVGGQWVRFSQTLAGGNEGSHSAWVVSPRFEVEPEISGKADF